MAVSSLVTSDILDEVDGNNSTSIDAYLFNLTRSKKIPFEEMEGIEFQMQLFSQLSKESPRNFRILKRSTTINQKYKIDP